MTIDGIKGMQVAGYQNSQQSAKPVETVSVDATNQAAVQSVKVDTKDTGKETAYDGQRKEATNDQIKKAVSDMNKKMANTSCQFGIHEGTGRVTIKIIDKETKDVIKEFPAEETLEMIEKAWELAGIMVDEKL